MWSDKARESGFDWTCSAQTWHNIHPDMNVSFIWGIFTSRWMNFSKKWRLFNEPKTLILLLNIRKWLNISQQIQSISFATESQRLFHIILMSQENCKEIYNSQNTISYKHWNTNSNTFMRITEKYAIEFVKLPSWGLSTWLSFGNKWFFIT